MKFNDIIDNPPLWLEGDGPFNEIVLLSIIRLVRNLDGYIFPTRAKEEQLEIMSDLVKDVVLNSPHFKDVFLISTVELSKSDIDIVKERHLLKGSRRIMECIVTRGEKVIVNLNEEDHIRIECRASGFDLETLYSVIFDIDDAISSKLVYAFREDYGYLTSCPTNLGTGMRLSCILHLPGLVLTKKINKLLKDISSHGFSVKGLYGKEGEVEGSFFQIKNLKTLGLSEEDIVRRTNGEVRAIIDLEKKARDKLMEEVGKRLEDKIWRAYGILKNARMLSQKEFVNLSSAVRLGIGLGLIDNIDLKTLNHLLLYTGPAHIQRLKGSIMDKDTRCIERANYVRRVLRYR